MGQGNSPKDARGQLAIAAQIAESKRKQRESALLRSKTDVRRTSSASTQNSQVTERPPQAYQAPQMNIPEDFHEVAKLVHEEFAKIAQSQSVLLSLWQKLSHMGVDGSGVTFGTGNLTGASPDGAGIELGWNSDQTISYIDFHSGGKQDYDARLRVDIPSDTSVAGMAGLQIYAGAIANHNSNFTNPPYLHPDPHYFKATHGSPYVMPVYTASLTGTDNLNTFGHTNGGIYHNAANANATTANNYPVPYAGTLEVIPSSVNQGGTMQRYVPYNNPAEIFQRCETSPGAWTPWQEFTGKAVAIEEAVTRAKREIYAELLALNAGIVVPVVIE